MNGRKRRWEGEGEKGSSRQAFAEMYLDLVASSNAQGA